MTVTASRTEFLTVPRDDQMMLGIHRRLEIIPDDTRPAARARHRTRIWVGQRHLLVGREPDLFFARFKAAQLVS
jgi:hypothetical protein